MSSRTLEAQIAQLEQQRAGELRHLNMVYARTQRDLRRAVSPTRFVRKHLPATLIVAAVSGVLLARGMGRGAAAGRGERRSRLGGLLSLLMRVAHPLERFFPGRVVPAAASAAEDREGSPTAAGHGARHHAAEGPINVVVQTVLQQLLTQINFGALLSGLLDRLRASPAMPPHPAAREDDEDCGAAVGDADPDGEDRPR
jgi:hypothetical protein